jgi:hypothetical protein
LQQAATTALIEILAEPREKRVFDTLSACGVDRAELESYVSGISPGDRRMASAHADASALASRLGLHDVWSHHVVALALARDPLPDEVTNRKLRRSAHRSVTELETDIRKWTSEWNKDPKPFTWIKSADEILETLAAYCPRVID